MTEMNFSNIFILPNTLQGLFLFYHMIDIKILLEYSLFAFLFLFRCYCLKSPVYWTFTASLKLHVFRVLNSYVAM